MRVRIAVSLCILGLSAVALAIPQPLLPGSASTQPASMPSQEQCRQQADAMLTRLDSSFLGAGHLAVEG